MDWGLRSAAKRRGVEDGVRAAGARERLTARCVMADPADRGALRGMRLLLMQLLLPPPPPAAAEALAPGRATAERGALFVGVHRAGEEVTSLRVWERGGAAAAGRCLRVGVGALEVAASLS